jgi:hypothetical protein
MDSKDTTTPWAEIETVLAWLAGGISATSSARARFYAKLVIELLNRRGERVIGPLEVPLDHPLLEHRAPDMPYSAMFRWQRSDIGAYQLEGCIIRRTDGEPFLPSDIGRLGWRQMLAEDVEGRRAVAAGQAGGQSRPEPSEVAGGESRRRYDVAYYADVARLYDQAVASGDRAPVRYVAAQLGLKPSTVKNHVHRARTMGLLPETEPRRARGNPRR